jgi:hypothetical protein
MLEQIVASFISTFVAIIIVAWIVLIGTSYHDYTKSNSREAGLLLVMIVLVVPFVAVLILEIPKLLYAFFSIAYSSLLEKIRDE